MAQWVMVARAGLQSNAVMLLDEPTAFLDIVGKEEVLGVVGRVARGRAHGDPDHP